MATKPTTKKATAKKPVAKKATKPATTTKRQKYDYPEDVVTSEDKKKFRAKMRREAAKASKSLNGTATPKKATTKKATTTAKKKAPVKKKPVSIED